MAVEPRPVDTVTKENLFVGTPIVLFERKLSSGAFDVPFNLGIVEGSELQKVVQLLELRDAASGLQVLNRRSVGAIEPLLQLSLFNFEPDVMRYLLGSCSTTVISAALTVVLDDEVTVPDAFTKFASLDNRNVTTEPLTDLDAKTVTLEAVGTGDGVLGTTDGDFALDFPVFVLTDLSGGVFTIGGVDRTGDLVAGVPGAGQIGLTVGAVPNSGFLDFEGTGGGAVPAAGDAIVATYTPTFTFTNGTDYILDLFEGRIRFLSTDKVRADQIVLADYSYNRAATTRLTPFTQNAFEGKATVKQLTDIGINFIWTIPSASIRVNDEALTWSAEDFATGSLTMDILSDGSAAPFGTFDQFPETPVVCA